MEMVRQLPAGESVAAKYEGYETSAMADGRILSATEHGAEIFVPDIDFFNKIQSQLEADDNADIDIGCIDYDDTMGDMIAQYAMSKVGCSYVWGASRPNTFDCSGLVNWCAKMCGLSVPWARVSGVSATNTRRSAANAQGYINAGKAILTGEMKQGDFIFFASEGASNTVKNITHVGDGKFVDARNKKKGVLLSEYSAYWKKRTMVVARLELVEAIPGAFDWKKRTTVVARPYDKIVQEKRK
ncbi:MAG: C40 family peptidase [Lachnospiraceae bacterium]|nr:C40 family peptidase [Lachnospiraceae bacterium]